MTNIKINYINPISKAENLLDSSVKVTGEFEELRDDGKKIHRGIDYRASEGTPVYAAADGVVINAGHTDSGYGNFIIVKHSNGESTLYAHLEHKPSFLIGSKVDQGQEIAKSGNTGIGSGPHLHFEVIGKDGTNNIEKNGSTSSIGIAGSFDRYNPASRDLTSTSDLVSAKNSLVTTLATITVTAQKEAAAKSWFETFSDSLSEWTGSSTNFIKEVSKDVINFFSTPQESIAKIGGWISSALTFGASDQTPNPSTVNNSLLNLTVNISDSSNNALSDPNSFVNGTVKSGGDYSIDMPSNVLNQDGLNNQEASKITANEIRPGAQTLTQNINSNWLERTANFIQENITQPITNAANSILGGIQSAFSTLTNLFTQAPRTQNVDPLVLDLDGDGVELISFNNSKVTFDVDNDNYKENTGWVGKDDGILVDDKNSNGKIDNITETISEYYTTNVSDGLEALKTLDSNNDNIFDNKDQKWTQLKIWQDKNEDGYTDEGELKTLEESNIKSIDLNRTISYRERLEGNPVLSRSTYTTTDNQSREAAAVDFTTNPIGYEWNDAYEHGIKLTSQDNSSSSFIINDANGATINLEEKGVNSGYGNIGNDIIIGDDKNNWIMGSKGSDTLKSGAGDDIILIDSEDENSNIDAGSGLDVIKVVDNKNIVFNMMLSNAEIMNSGDGDDILIGGGTSNVFISGGAGDDVIIGGAADDALSGEDGDDYIDGAYGDDVIRGHRGNDILKGASGNDYIEGGLGDDKIFGDSGNDILAGNEGNDEIDGGDGFDMIEYSGKYDQYIFKRNADGTVSVIDTKDGSSDIIKNVEKLRFDHVDISVAGDKSSIPLPVKDNIVVNNNKIFEIDQSQLLANDFSVNDKKFSVKNVSDAVGGKVEIRADGKIIFTADPNFIGTMSFDYSIIDQDGNYATITRKKSDGTLENADLRAQVNLVNNSDPADPLYFDQWYLSEIKVKPVWQDYSGKGITVGIFEGNYGNPLNYSHPDLKNNIDNDYIDNVLIKDDVVDFSNHATLVAGVIAAEKNNIGGMGIAYNAKISSLSWDSDIFGLGKLADYDIANNSWINTALFGDDFKKENNENIITARARMMENAAEIGRDGLGTNIIFAGGNARQEGDNVNYHNTQNSRFVITTGSINQEGDLSKLIDASQPFSNPGSAILVSAPGSNIKSTANLLENSNGSTFGSDFESTQGTSFSAPIVSGVVALMLEANPNLGYRDVQLILAKTARKISDDKTTWKNNGDKTINSGEGMHYSEDYGFGIIDAHAAVRMAEAWMTINNSLNEQKFSASNNNGLNILDNGIVNSVINISDSKIKLEHVEVYVDIDHNRIGDLVITLVSPDGTESVLLNRPGKPLQSDQTNYGSSQNGLKFNLSSTHYYGEIANGNWTLKIEDKATGVSGILNNWDLKLYGSTKNADDNYVFTKEFNSDRTISDSTGIDSIDATGITSNSSLDLRSGSANVINNKKLTISANTVIENAYLGDGDDILIGNDAANILYAGRGNNKITGGLGADKFVISKSANQTDIITDFSLDKNEKIDLEKFGLSNYQNLQISQESKNTIINLGNGQKLILENILSTNLTADNFTGFLNEKEYLNSANLGDNLYGDDRDSIILGSEGNDYINAGKGNNIMTGGNGDDIFFIENNSQKTDIINDFNSGIIKSTNEKISLRNFKEIRDINDLSLEQVGLDTVIKFGDNQKLILKNINKEELTNNNFIFSNEILATENSDIIFGSDLPDLIKGQDGDDQLLGFERDDYINGNNGDDVISGGQGNDILYGDMGYDVILGGVGSDTIYGGQDNDTLFAGSQNDPLNSDNKSNIIYGEAGSDTIYGDKGSDKLYGGFGDDFINGDDGDDEIYGQENNDTIYGNSGNDKIFGGDDNDLIYAGLGNDEIHGGKGNDRIEAIAGDNLIYGDEGDDLIFGGSGSDTIFGGQGNDTIVGEDNNKAINGGKDFIYGEDGDDVLLGAANDDEIYGGNGNDILQGDLGNDKLFGGEGQDILRANQGQNEYTGGGGNDIFAISENSNQTEIINDFEINNVNEKINLLALENIKDFNQLKFSQSANDTIIELLNNQKIILKNINKFDVTRNNFITSNTAPEVISNPTTKNGFINRQFSFNIQNSFADKDGDVLQYTAKLADGSNIPSWINFDPTTLTFSGVAISSGYSALIVVTATDPYGASVSLSFNLNINNGVTINGTPGNDFSVGSTGNDFITGAAGNDYLFGGVGNDIISGDDGDDNIRGDVDAIYNQNTGIISTFNYNSNTGNDTLYGNNGDDTILGDRGDDIIFGGDGDDILIGSDGVDEIYGGNGNDQIVGGTDSNPSLTDSGNNKIYGEAGSDIIWGANGVDIIYGGDENDTIYANKGDDIIYDGKGKDIVYAGEGNDIVYLEGQNQLTTFNGSIDTAFVGEAGNDIFVINKDLTASAGSGLLNDIIFDFEVNNINEKIDLTAFKNIRDISDLKFSNVLLNGVQFLKVFVAGEESLQYISLKGITQSQLTNSNFNFFADKAPIATNDNFATNEDNSIIIKISDLLLNDSDGEDIDAKFYQISSLPLFGKLISNNDGSYTYQPQQDFNGSDSFSYKIKDSNGAIRSATVKIDVKQVNDNPTATITSITTNEDNSAIIDVLSGALDVDEDALSIAAITNAAHGKVSIITDSSNKQKIIYTPNNNFAGSDSFDYTISDGKGGSITKTISINVNQVNDAPNLIKIVEDKTVYLNHQINFNVSGVFNDVDGDIIKYSATLSNGDPLPDWLKFDSNSLEFSGISPKDAKNMTIKLSATDLQGAKSSTNINFIIDNSIFFGTADDDMVNNFGFPPVYYQKIYAGLGNDSILMTSFNQNILNQTIHEYYGEQGNDHLQVYSTRGKFYVNGGEGDDKISTATENSELYGESGNDIFYLNTIRNYNYIDKIGSVFGGNNKIFAGEGDDILWVEVGSKNNSLYGNSGNDHFVFDESKDSTNFINDFESNDKINLSLTNYHKFEELQIVQENQDAKIILANNQFIILKNYEVSLLKSENFIFQTNGDDSSNYIESAGSYLEFIDGKNGDDVLYSNQSSGDVHLKGGEGSDRFIIEKNSSELWTDIEDFDINNPNEKIQLSGFGNLKFSDLDIFYSEPHPTLDISDYATIYISQVNQRIRISNVAENSLTADHFIFDSSPKTSLESVAFNEDDNTSLIDILSYATDADGDKLIISSVTQTKNGVVAIKSEENGSQKISYKPNPNFSGLDQFDYTISDGKGGFVTKTLSINVKAVNDNPKIENLQAEYNQTEKDFAISLADKISDVDNEALTVTLTQASGEDLPSWLTFDSGTKIIRFSPTDYNFSDQIALSLVVSDLQSQSKQDFVLKFDRNLQNPISLVGDANNYTKSTIYNDLITGTAADESISLVADGKFAKNSSYKTGIPNFTNFVNHEPIEIIDGAIELRDPNEINLSNKNYFNDSINAGDGVDTINLTAESDIFIFDNKSSTQLNFSSVEQINAGAGDDVIITTGNNQNISINGGSGRDIIISGDGDDFINGSIGDDIIYGQDGNDLLIGMDGQDEIHAGNGDDKITGNYGDDILFGEDGNDTIHGGQDNDTIHGGNGNDIIFGNGENDKIYGDVGNDYINGNEGNDIIFGGLGNDNLKGDIGDDIIISGLGKDIITGGQDSDIFVFNAIEESTNVERDAIIDFIKNEDKIYLVGLNYNAIYQGKGSSQKSLDALEFYFDKNGDTIIDDPNSDFAIRLQGQIKLSSEDFVF